jgi:predicted 2-oxoglutarate/Fe(II)-dependent dioxygenase YbiX
MQPAITNATQIPLFQKGRQRIKQAIRASFATRQTASHSLPIQAEPLWTDSYIQPFTLNSSSHKTLAGLGYRSSPIEVADVHAITGIAEVHNLFSEDCIEHLRRICRNLEEYASKSDWIISNRTRGITKLSRFLNDMMNSRDFLLTISRIAGVPLVPYPMLNARAQVNYFRPAKDKAEKAEIAQWHTDGTSFVLNLLLSSRDEFEGGDFLFFDGTIDRFEPTRLTTDIRRCNIARGDAVYIFGSRLYHGVTPVTAGRRMSLALSFHCPYSSRDVNRFWHLASDDGIPKTLKNWTALKVDLIRSAASQFKRAGIHPITLEEVARAGTGIMQRPS